MASPLKLDFTSAFDRQYKKFSDSDKDIIDAAIRDLTKLVNMNPNTEEAKELAVALRTKVIQRFRGETPKRMEATFAPDGRIVWSIDRKARLLRFIYIGNHSVLDKK